VAAPSPRPTRPAARRRAVPGQRPCLPRPPAPLLFPSPLQPMCGQNRPRAADPTVNPARSSGPAVLSPLGKTFGALNASCDGAPAPEDAPEAASTRVPGCLGSLVPPGPQLEGPSRGDVAALRCPPPAGPPVGLSCWSVLPASWSRLRPAALSAHSYLGLPRPAGAAAAMAPPRGHRGLRLPAAAALPRTWAGGLQMPS
jgi:hypothetical protein